MKKQELSGRQRRHRYIYSRNIIINAAMPNHLGREFSVEAPNEKWVTDITYIPTRQCWCYLAAVAGLYSRKVVGWDVAKTMTAELDGKAHTFNDMMFYAVKQLEDTNSAQHKTKE